MFSVKNVLVSSFEKFLDLIYNKKCLICSCSKTDEYLCKNCAKTIEYLNTFPHKIYNDVEIYSAFIYKDIIKKLICLLKFKHKKSASIILSRLLYNYFLKLDIKNHNFVIVFPPSYFLKSACRGYEHLYLIAKQFSNLSGYSLERNLIKKIKYTPAQYKAKNRFKNIKDSFKVNKKLVEKYKDKNILLIDDIITSGATIAEITDKLKEAGIKNIFCLTVSKTIN